MTAEKRFEVSHCNTCARETNWYFGKTGKWSRCEGCDTRFPCASKKCGHVDCQEARGEIVLEPVKSAVAYDGPPEHCPKGCVSIRPKT